MNNPRSIENIYPLISKPCLSMFNKLELSKTRPNIVSDDLYFDHFRVSFFMSDNYEFTEETFLSEFVELILEELFKFQKCTQVASSHLGPGKYDYSATSENINMTWKLGMCMGYDMVNQGIKVKLIMSVAKGIIPEEQVA